MDLDQTVTGHPRGQGGPESSRHTGPESSCHSHQAAVWSDPQLSGADQVRAAAIAGAAANVWRANARADYLDRIQRIRFTAEWARPWRAGTLPSARLSQPIEQLTATAVPVLLLHGAYDMTFPAELAHRAADLLPDAAALVLEDAAHMAHIDQPDQWIAAVTARFRNCAVVRGQMG